MEYRSWGALLAAEEDRVTTVGVSKLLKEGTKVAHKAAENVRFVREFIHGNVSRELYQVLVTNLYFIYHEMEEAMKANSEHRVVAAVFFDELLRTESLGKDLAFFLGPDWRSCIRPSPITKAYVDRLSEIRASRPELLVAHAYTRYLGDLSGGQILKRAAVKGLGLTQGLSFYDFDQISDIKVCKGLRLGNPET
jgi:heme oxygenase